MMGAAGVGAAKCFQSRPQTVLGFFRLNSFLYVSQMIYDGQ